MSEIFNVSGYAPPAMDRFEVSRPQLDRNEASPDSTLHPLERFDAALQGVLSQTGFRLARLRAIRGEVQAGTFETQERLRGTVDRLLGVLG